MDLDNSADGSEAAIAWLGEHGIHKLNVAGPSENQQPGCEGCAFALLRQLLAGAISPTIPDRHRQND